LINYARISLEMRAQEEAADTEELVAASDQHT
jgi:hypothetical protein